MGRIISHVGYVGYVGSSASLKKMVKTSFIFPRRVARFAAVQGLFQGLHRDMIPEDIIHEFTTYRFTSEREYPLFDQTPHLVDIDHFLCIMRGVHASQVLLDEAIREALPSKHPFHWLESCTLCILRCGAFELSSLNDIPKAVILDEYITIAHSFLLEKGPVFVNGVLDSIAHRLRPSQA